MLASALEELNRSDLPVHLALDHDRPDVVPGRHQDVSAFLWGSVTDEATRCLGADELCRRLVDKGDAGLTGLGGHYALVVIDRGYSRVRILSDRFVTHRLYYSLHQGRVWISDSLSRLRGAMPETPPLAPAAVLDYLYFHMIPSPGTFYAGIHTLNPAECVQVTKGGIERRHHWQPRFNPDTHLGEQALAAELFSTLEQAVADTVTNAKRSGCFLSGGLDSSSIAGLLARCRPGIDAFSIGFPLKQYNELDYARCAVNHFGLSGHEYTMSPSDVVEALPLVVGSMDQPFGNSSVVPAYFCARMARENGIERLVAGDGGDELFAGNSRYAHQLKLERWREKLGPLVGLLDTGLLKPPWPDRPALLRKAKSFTRQLGMTVPENLEYYNFLNLIERRSIFSAELLEQLDLTSPEQRCQALYDQPGDATALDRMLFMDWKHTLADNDLVKVSSMCKLAGVEVAYPMLDDRLVDLSLRIPADLKLTPGNLRHLYKRSMQGFLPEKILHKEKHGFGLPFGLWTQEHGELRDLAYDALDSLHKHNLFNPEFIREVKRLHQQEHAKHYGELVWVLMVLALWLDRNH